MILNIRVVPKASRNLINPAPARSGGVKKENEYLKAYLTKPDQDGLANAQLIELLAKHLNVKRYQIRIISGHKSRDKIIEVDEGAGFNKK